MIKNTSCKELQNKEDSNAVPIVCQKLWKSSVTPRVTRSECGQTALKPYSHFKEMMVDYKLIGYVP